MELVVDSLLTVAGTRRSPRTRALTFINRDFVQRHRLETTPLPQPVLLRNIDGSANEHGSITEEVHTLLHFGQHSERAQFTVTNLG